MRRNQYESALLINAVLEDQQIESVIQKVKDTIEANGGTIKNIQKWGRKRLAYMINKNKVGYYTFFRFEAQSGIVAKLERIYKLEESIIRFLNIKLGKDAIEYLEAHSTDYVDDKVEVIEAQPEELLPEEVLPEEKNGNEN